MTHTDVHWAKCPKCLGKKFGHIHIFKAEDGRDWPHTKCLDCGTVQYAQVNKGWSTNGYCGASQSHYKEPKR